MAARGGDGVPVVSVRRIFGSVCCVHENQNRDSGRTCCLRAWRCASCDRSAVFAESASMSNSGRALQLTRAYSTPHFVAFTNELRVALV